MDIRKMTYFLASAECGSFTKAAEKCYISQTTMSQQIQSMERELGFKLFDRSDYRPKLTPSGESFYFSIKKIVDAYKQAVNSAKLLNNVNKEKLKIGISGPIEKKRLPPVIKQFLQVHPHIDIEIEEDSFSQLAKKLEDQSLDIIFGLSNDIDYIDHFSYESLFNSKLIVITSINHPWLQYSEVNGNDLKTEKLIVFSRKYSLEYYLAVVESCRKDGFEPEIAKEVDSYDELLLLVSINKGVAIVSEEAMQEIADVHKIRLKETHHKSEYCVAKNTNNTKSIIDSFIDSTVKEFKK